MGTLAWGTGLNLFGSLYSTAGRLGFSLIVAWLLDPGSLGTYFLALTVANILGLISVAGFDQALLRFLALHRADNNWAAMRGIVQFSLRAVGATGLIAGIVLLAGAPWIAATGFGKPELTKALQIVAVSIPLFALEMAVLSATQAFKEMKYKVWIDSVLNPTLKVGLTILFIALGWGIFGALLAHLITVAICLGFSLRALRSLLRTGPSHTEGVYNRSELLVFVTPLLGVTLVTVLLAEVDMLILGRLAPVEDVGIYSICVRIVLVLGFALPVVSQIFAPFISELYHKGEIEKLKGLFQLVTLWAFELFLPIALILMVGAPTLLSLFGDRFSTASTVLLVLVVGQLFNVITGPVGYVLTMTGRTRLQLWNSLLALAVQGGAAVILIPSWGLLGAAAANAGGMVCVNLARLVEAYWLLRIHPFSLSLAKPLCAAVLALSATLPLWGPGNMLSFGQAGILFVAILSVYVGTLALLGLDPASQLAWAQWRARLTRLPGRAVASSVGRENL